MLFVPLEEFSAHFTGNCNRFINSEGTNSWMRYLNGNAEISGNPMELEATLTFRLYKSRTLISSLDLHFYDEASKHLTLPEGLLKYISENERPLEVAIENRYKISRR